MNLRFKKKKILQNQKVNHHMRMCLQIDSTC